jgi:alpha-galactosidase
VMMRCVLSTCLLFVDLWWGRSAYKKGQYKAHFTLWSLLGSVLLMGNNLLPPHLPASALTILNNPAILAISQNPLAKPGIRRQRNLNVKKDKYGIGETQVWSRKLWGGDWAVVLLNAADEDVEMSVEMEELFYKETGKAEEVGRSWEVFDLWGNRMEESVAEKILSGEKEEGLEMLRHLGWYNSSEKSWEDGIVDGDERLLGKSVGKLEPGETIKHDVKRHSVAAFRLRDPAKGVGNAGKIKDEL